MLQEQQSLTAVERFAQRHAANDVPDARIYEDLIPLSKPGPGQQYGFRVDLDVCTGCKACVAACHSLNGLDEEEAWRSVGLLHGGMQDKAKDGAMEAFSAGQLKILVATTVIEVGVNVPNANIMVIEHAERFGLAQLHQLRGRIGRGTERSTCLLLYKGPLGETAKARLNIMRETEDGFRIAEEDLKLRGEGDVLGTRQSGMPGFRLARIEAHGKLIGAARDDAALVLAQDPTLASPRGQALRHLLYLFERDEAIRLIRAG